MGFENRPKDFFAKQIRSSHLIASGGIIDPASSDWDEQLPNLRLMIYPRDTLEVASSATGTDYIEGAFEGIVPPQLLDDGDGSGLKVGNDVWLFVSGAQHTHHTYTEDGEEAYAEVEKRAKSGVVLFGGDVVISGTLFAERQVVEVDLSQEGELFISGNLVAQDYTADINFVQFMAPEDDYPRDWLTGEDAALTFHQDVIQALVDIYIDESILRFTAGTDHVGENGNDCTIQFINGTGTSINNTAAPDYVITFEPGVSTPNDIIALSNAAEVVIEAFSDGGNLSDAIDASLSLEFSGGGDGIHELAGGVDTSATTMSSVPDAEGDLHNFSDAPEGWSTNSVITVAELNEAIASHRGDSLGQYEDREAAIIGGAVYDAYDPRPTGPQGTGHTLFNIDSINHYVSINASIPSASLDIRRQNSGATNTQDQIILLSEPGDLIGGSSTPLLSMKDGNTGAAGHHDDTAFYVWGVPGGKAGFTPGTNPDYTVGVFGGDLVVSGALYNESGFLDISSTHDHIGSPASDPTTDPDVPGDGTVIGTLQFSGTETAGDLASGKAARIEAEAAEDWSPGDTPARLNFFTNHGGAVWDDDGPMGGSAESTTDGLAMTIDHNQTVGIGIEVPTAKLHISSTSSLDSDHQLLLHEADTGFSRLSFTNEEDTAGPFGQSHEWTIAAKPEPQGSNTDARLNFYYGDGDNAGGGVDHVVITGAGQIGAGVNSATGPAARIHAKIGDVAETLALLESGDTPAKLHIKSDNNAVIMLEADANNAGGEDNNPYIQFLQDGGSHKAIIGLVGSSGEDPEGEPFSDTLANSLLIGGENTASSVDPHLQFGTRDEVRVTIRRTGETGIGTNDPNQHVEIQKDDVQLRLSYDETNYIDFEVDSTGDLDVTGSSTSNIRHRVTIHGADSGVADGGFWGLLDPEDPLSGYADVAGEAAATNPIKIIGLKEDNTDYDDAGTPEEPKVLVILEDGTVAYKSGGLGGAQLKDDRDGREDLGDFNTNEIHDGQEGDDHDGGGATVTGNPYDNGLIDWWTGDTQVGHALDDVNHALLGLSNSAAWLWPDTDGISGGDKVTLRDETNQVGIGTDDPMQKVHVYGGETSNAAIRIESNETDSNGTIVNPIPHTKLELSLNGNVHGTLSQNTRAGFTTSDGTDTILQNHTPAGGIYLSTVHEDFGPPVPVGNATHPDLDMTVFDFSSWTVSAYQHSFAFTETPWEAIQFPIPGGSGYRPAIPGDKVAAYREDGGNRYYLWSAHCVDVGSGTQWEYKNGAIVSNLTIMLMGNDGLGATSDYYNVGDIPYFTAYDSIANVFWDLEVCDTLGNPCDQTSGVDTFNTSGASTYAKLTATGLGSLSYGVPTTSVLAPIIADSSGNVDKESLQVLILSGTHGSDPLLNPRTFADTNFYVSGSIGSCVEPTDDSGNILQYGNGTRGTAVFGGDVYVSGTIFGAGGALGGGGGWRTAMNGVCIDVFADAPAGEASTGDSPNSSEMVFEFPVDSVGDTTIRIVDTNPIGPIFFGLAYSLDPASGNNGSCLSWSGSTIDNGAGTWTPNWPGDQATGFPPGRLLSLTVEGSNAFTCGFPAGDFVAWINSFQANGSSLNATLGGNNPSASVNVDASMFGFSITYPPGNVLVNLHTLAPSHEPSARFVSWGADGTAGYTPSEGAAAFTGDTFTRQNWAQGLLIPFDCKIVGYSVRYISEHPINFPGLTTGEKVTWSIGTLGDGSDPDEGTTPPNQTLSYNEYTGVSWIEWNASDNNTYPMKYIGEGNELDIPVFAGQTIAIRALEENCEVIDPAYQIDIAEASVTLWLQGGNVSGGVSSNAARTVTMVQPGSAQSVDDGNTSSLTDVNGNIIVENLYVPDLTANENCLCVECPAGQNVHIRLPDPTGLEGKTLMVKDKLGTAGDTYTHIQVSPQGSATLDQYTYWSGNAQPLKFDQSFACVMLWNDGTDWFVS